MQQPRRARRRRAQRGQAGQDGLLNRFGEVLPRVEPVGDPHRAGRCVPGGPGVSAAPVPADHLDAGMGVQPVREGLRFPIRQHADEAVAVHVHQNGGIRVTLALGDIIHPEHGDLPGLRIRQRPDQQDQGEPGHDHPGRRGQPGTRAAGQRQRDPLQQDPSPAVRAGTSWSAPVPARRTSPPGTSGCRRTGGPPARPAPAARRRPDPTAGAGTDHAPGRKPPRSPGRPARPSGSWPELHRIAQILDMIDNQACQVREQQDQQASFSHGELVQHN